MAEAVGEYYMFLDSDDWIDGTVCEEAYNAAKAEEADIVQYSCVTEYYTEVSEGHKRWRGKYLSPYCEVILGEDILNAAYVENKYATSYGANCLARSCVGRLVRRLPTSLLASVRTYSFLLPILFV